jgi:hypothetical protein
MTPLRMLSTLLVAGGLIGGTLTDDDTVRTPALSGVEGPRRVDGYFVLAADLHVHGFFGDGALAPWDLRDEARRQRLDVIALTNHHSTLAGRLERWHDNNLPLFIPGQEVTAPGYHIVALGITDAIDWRQSAAQAIDTIHARGGAAIAAHPTRNYWPAYDDAAIRRLDGVEVAHPGTKADPAAAVDFRAFYARAKALKPAIAAIGSSDFHFHAPLGLCRTYVFAREISQQGVIDAVREGRTVAFDDEAHAIGAESLARAIPPDQLAPAPSRWATVAAACAWLGLLGLVLL